MSILNIEDLDKTAQSASDELERKRLAKVAKINKATEARQAQMKSADAERRDEEQKRLKLEVKSQYLMSNLWAKDADFEKAWKDDKERLIREHQTMLVNVPRM
jgi:Skp family chaperone for outer membrane proteins